MPLTVVPQLASRYWQSPPVEAATFHPMRSKAILSATVMDCRDLVVTISEICRPGKLIFPAVFWVVDVNGINAQFTNAIAMQTVKRTPTLKDIGAMKLPVLRCCEVARFQCPVIVVE